MIFANGNSELASKLCDALKMKFRSINLHYVKSKRFSKRVNVVFVDAHSKFYESGVKKCDKLNSNILQCSLDVGEYKKVYNESENALRIEDLRSVLQCEEGKVGVINKFVAKTMIFADAREYMLRVIEEYSEKSNDVVLCNKKVVLYFDVESVCVQENILSFKVSWDARVVNENDLEYWLTVD